MEVMGESETKTIKGKSIGVDGKVIYPIIQISIQKNLKGNIVSAGVIPIAVVVVEDSKRYILPLTDKIMDLDDTVEKIIV